MAALRMFVRFSAAVIKIGEVVRDVGLGKMGPSGWHLSAEAEAARNTRIEENIVIDLEIRTTAGYYYCLPLK